MDKRSIELLWLSGFKRNDGAAARIRIMKATTLALNYLNGVLEKSGCVGSSSTSSVFPNDGIRIYSANGANGAIYFDDIIITTTPMAPINLIATAGTAITTTKVE